MDMPSRICVVGLGLIGGSLAADLRGVHWVDQVVGYDVDASVVRRAVKLGLVDVCAGGGLADAVAGCGLVIVAVPVGSIATVTREAMAGAPPGALVTDVGSVKAQLVAEVECAMPVGARFVGGHPMAGAEDCGVGAARRGLFKGAAYVLTPTGNTDPEALAVMSKVATSVGAHVMIMGPAAHDEIVAVVSHVPQVAATALMNAALDEMKSRPAGGALAAGGFRDMTRIAGSGPEIWSHILTGNSSEIGRVLEVFEERLGRLRRAIRERDEGAIWREMERARSGRAVMIEVGDTAGSEQVQVVAEGDLRNLGEALTAAGEAGVGLADLDLRRLRGRERPDGRVVLTTLSSKQAALASEHLESRGFRVRLRGQ
ncbi:MAG: prephenate dehydrogenase/arogenate dehydrogenase family protein [Actinomycetota bacterium]